MLRTLDLIIIVVYLLVVIGIGLRARGKQESAEDYFTAGGGLGTTFGSLLVGLSIAATLFSGISFLAYPSVVYVHGVVLFVGVAVISMPVAWLTLRWFLPRYLAHDHAQPYDVIERKFGPGTRTLSAVLYVMMRIGWMAALIYAPSLAIMAAMGLGPAWFWPVVLVIGLTSTLYTVFGGIRSVIVTDAIQFCIIALGIALTIGYILWYIPVPISQAVTDLNSTGHFHWLDFSTDPKAALTFWTVGIGVTIANMGNYIADQMSLQRYLAGGTSRAALRSFTINVFGVLVVLLLLVGVGLALNAWYRHTNDPNLPSATDKIFPYFLTTQLPSGISGLLLAALIAATMSSMTSGINTLAGAVTMDFRVRFGSAMSGAQQLRFGRWSSLVIGLASTGVAGLVSRLGGLFDLTQIILGVFAGPLLVCVLLSVSKLRTTGVWMSAGLVAGCAAGWVGAFSSSVASLWVAPCAAATTALLALGGTLLAPGATDDTGRSDTKASYPPGLD